MHKVILSIGTNYNREQNIKLVKEKLEKLISGVKFTEELLTEPLGDIKNEEKFVNFIISGFTNNDVEHIVSKLKQLETECGNTKHLRNEGKIAMDIDLLKYDEQCFHESDWTRCYIMELMKQIDKIDKTIEQNENL